jgi:flagellar basal-body rod modification protein FlgD
MIVGLPNVPTKQETSAPAGLKKSLGKDDFMKLMIAQLQAQDPTNPLDAQDFSSQLAQFSSLEQQLAMNKNLEEISKNQAALNNSSMIGLIGKSVNSPGKTVQFSPGEIKALSYELQEDANSVSIDIFDSEGNEIITIKPGAQSAGVNKVQWSGVDNRGNSVPEGTYTYRVRGTNSSGEEFDSKTFASGKVSEVVFENGISYVIVNGNKIPAYEVSRVGLN